MQLPIVFLLLAVCLQKFTFALPVEQSLSREDDPLCRLYDAENPFYAFISCQMGAWPTTTEPAQEFSVDTVVTLRIRRVTVQRENFQTLFHVKPKYLELTLISMTDGSNFPFYDFVKGLAKDGVQSLTLESVALGAISERDFEGFSNLIVLDISDAKLQSIHPDSFQHFSGVPELGFSSLSISYESVLTAFPWESLRSFSDSLMMVHFEKNSKMTQITYTKAASALRFNLLEMVKISYTGVSTIDQEIVDTFSNDPSWVYTVVHFIRNRNTCAQREQLAPLISWIIGNVHDRYLIATCISEDGGVSEHQGQGQAWIQCEEPVCKTSSF